MHTATTAIRIITVAATLIAPAAFAGQTGVVMGTVKLVGAPPERKPLEVFKHHEVCGDSVPDDRFVIGPAGGVRYAVVTVEGVKNGKAVERDLDHVLDNRQCRFVPHVQVAEVGQWLEITNSDPILHNADARMGNETLFNVALPPARSVRKPLARPGIVTITCDVRHTWMSAVVVVTDHPNHTVTDLYGNYEIRDLPPGTYTVRVWHEELGTTERPITIVAGEVATVDVAYAPGGARPESAEGGKEEMK